MGQCGCGEHPNDKAYRITRGVTLGVKLYQGCPDCFNGLALDLYFYNRAKNEWLKHVPIEDGPKPDEYGGNGGQGIPLPLFEVEDLRAAVKELDEYQTLDAYDGDLDFWLEENGLDLLRASLRKFRERMDKLERERSLAQKEPPCPTKR